jgi:hypothetical protein
MHEVIILIEMLEDVVTLGIKFRWNLSKIEKSKNSEKNRVKR